MQLLKAKYLRLGKEKSATKRASPSTEDATKADAPTGTSGQSDSQADGISLTSSRWDDFCRKYDQWPREVAGNSATLLDPSIRTMHIENVLYHMDRLQVCQKMLLEQFDKDECSRSSCTPERQDSIEHEIDLYTNAVKNFERWLKNLNICQGQTEMEPFPQKPGPVCMGQQVALAISALQEPEREESGREESTGADCDNNDPAKPVQGAAPGWVSRASRAGDAIVMMMGSRGFAPPMTRGFGVLALVIATIFLAAFLMTVYAI